MKYLSYKLLFLVPVCLTLILWHSLNNVRNGENGISDVTSNRKKVIEIIFNNMNKNPDIIYWNCRECKNEKHLVECGNLSCNLYFTNFSKMFPSNSEGAYIFYANTMDFEHLPLPRNPEKVIWALLHEESPQKIPELSHEMALNLFNFSSTFSRHSDVPFPLQHIKSLKHVIDTKYFVKTLEKNHALQEISPILYLQSNCGTFTDRDEYVNELKKFQHIDSYGDCLKSKHSTNYSNKQGYDYFNNLWGENLLKFIARYKFVITIENGVCYDYVSEKLWRAIHVGVVPIYFGSPSIRDWLPNEKSAILLEDFPKPKLMSQHINKLMHDDELYEEYLEHKTMGKISNQNLINELQLRPFQTDFLNIQYNLACFICKKLHKKEKEVNIVTTSHYNCPMPVSALSQRAGLSDASGEWKSAKHRANALFDLIMKSRGEDISTKQVLKYCRAILLKNPNFYNLK